MSAELKHLIRQLIADPLKLDRLEPDTERALVAALWAALGSGESPVHDGAQAVAVRSPAWSSEDLLTIDEAAAVLKVSPRSLYRHAKILPFACKLSRKVLRFSRSGITRWLASRRT